MSDDDVPNERTTSVNRWMTGSVVALLAMTTACGGDDPISSASSGPRSEVLAQLMDEVEASGAKVDEACASKVVDQLSDDDIAKIVAAGPDGDPNVSADADALALQLFECVEDFGTLESGVPSDISIPEGVEITDAMVDAMVTSLESSGMTVDRDCIGEALEGMDLAEVAAQGSAPSPEFIQMFIGCVTP